MMRPGGPERCAVHVHRAAELSAGQPRVHVAEGLGHQFVTRETVTASPTLASDVTALQRRWRRLLGVSSRTVTMSVSWTAGAAPRMRCDAATGARPHAPSARPRTAPPSSPMRSWMFWSPAPATNSRTAPSVALRADHTRRRRSRRSSPSSWPPAAAASSRSSCRADPPSSRPSRCPARTRRRNSQSSAGRYASVSPAGEERDESSDSEHDELRARIRARGNSEDVGRVGTGRPGPNLRSCESCDHAGAACLPKSEPPPLDRRASGTVLPCPPQRTLNHARAGRVRTLKRHGTGRTGVGTLRAVASWQLCNAGGRLVSKEGAITSCVPSSSS